MKDLEDICIWKITANDPKSTTFQSKDPKFYKCFTGDGKKYCCPDYLSMNSIKEIERLDDED